MTWRTAQLDFDGLHNHTAGSLPRLLLVSSPPLRMLLRLRAGEGEQSRYRAERAAAELAAGSGALRHGTLQYYHPLAARQLH